ncbi:MAG: hypothetical protein ACAI44_34475 [Candidatus Sericytochromatia bacterium]
MAASVTVHLDLLRAVLEQGRADGFASRDALQLALWLIYRILELDFRCMEAYLFLAYLFCLLQDWTRACQILLHADRLEAGHAGIQAMLTQIRFTLQHPLPAVLPGPAQAVGPVLQTDSVATVLPQLDELKKQLQAELPEPNAMPQRFEKLAPVLQSLSRRLLEQP